MVNWELGCAQDVLLAKADSPTAPPNGHVVGPCAHHMPLSDDLSRLQALLTAGALTAEQFQLANARLLKKSGVTLKAKVDPKLLEAAKPKLLEPPRKPTPQEEEAQRLQHKEQSRTAAVAKAKRTAGAPFGDDPARAALRTLHDFSCLVEPLPPLGRCRSCNLGAQPNGLFLTTARQGRDAQGRVRFGVGVHIETAVLMQT